MDEKIKIKEQWYDLAKYKDEVQKYVSRKRNELDVYDKQYKNYEILYRSIFSGAEEADDKERYPAMKETYNVYKAALIEACTPGYSALMTVEGENPQSVLLAPELQRTMLEQFKSMSLLEMLSDEIMDDWIMKGEAIVFLKYKETTEEYRIKQTVTDNDTGEEMIKFTLTEGVTYEDIELERIDPLDFFVDAKDYTKDPKGCAKIVRSYISSKELLTSDAYPLLTKEDKEGILDKIMRRDSGYPYVYTNIGGTTSYGRTDKDQLEVLTFRGDYITNDYKILTNIKAVVIEGKLAQIEYENVDTVRLIYAPYKIDRSTHRGVSPLASSIVINKLANRVTDLFINNMDEVSNPIMMYKAGSMTQQAAREIRTKRQVELIGDFETPDFYAPPAVSPEGINLLKVILDQNKAMLGLNQYMSGDTSGSVRTAQESSILFQKANARLRVETDSFSYKFLKPLILAFYGLNRELALAADHPLKDIYAIPELKVAISTAAAKADKEGELNRLMQMLQLPIAQMIFSNLQPQQVIVAVRYLMAKADLSDADNLLGLIDEAGNTTELPPMDENGQPIPEQGVMSEQEGMSPQEQMMMEQMIAEQQQGGING